jgi:DNA-binding response OmpR family regulator
MESMRVLVVEDEPYMAEAIRDGLRLEAIAADIAGDGDTALELLGGNAYDIAVLDRDIPGPSGDEIAREVYRDGRYVALTRKQFAVLEVLVAAEGGVISAEELLARAWDENADPFTNAVRITVSALRKRLGEPWLIATVAGVGYRIDTGADAGGEGGDGG